MYQEIFSSTQLENDDYLQYAINKSGCSIKLQNQSPYGVEVYYGTNLIERVMPFNSVVLPNSDVTVKVNKDIKTELKQDYHFIAFKTITGEVKSEEGAQSFTGNLNVQGDMNIVNSQLDVNVVAPVTANISNSELNVSGKVEIQNETLNANITNADLKVSGDINIANTPNVEINNVVQTETNITNATLPVTGNVNATITNATVNTNIQNEKLNVEGNVNIQGGTVNANLTNPEIKANITNSEIKTTVNNVVKTETNITNATLPVTGNVNATITNAVMPVTGEVSIKSGVIQAEIKNASISTELVNAAIGVNSVVVMYEESYDIFPHNEQVKQIYARGLSTSKSIYDKFQIEVSMQGHHEEFELGDGQVIPETFYAEEIDFIEPNANGILCSGIYTDQRIYQSNFKQVTTTDEFGRPIQKGILYCYIEEPELLDEIQFQVASKVFAGYGGGRALGRIKVDVKVYAYNSKSFKNIKEGSEAFLKGIELGTDKNKTDSLISQNGTLKLNGNTVYEPLIYPHAGLNLNTLNVTGKYYSHTLTVAIGRPPQATTSAGFITHHERSAGYATQIFEQATVEHRIFHRRKMAGVWGEWHEVHLLGMEETPTEPNLLNGWEHYSEPNSTYERVSYWKDKNGIVHLHGLAKDPNATANIIFNLPVGYRPKRNAIFVVGANTSSFSTRVDVLASGNVNISTAGGNWSTTKKIGYISFEGVTFRAVDINTLEGSTLDEK